MSLLAALAKGLGAGTLQNAQAGFNEQTRQKEEDRRRGEMQTQILASRSEMDTQLRAQDKHLQTQIEASKEENRLSREAQATENQRNRDHDMAMFERRLAEATREASNSESVHARENHFKSLAGTFDALSKRKSEILESDKFATEEQRQAALADIDYIGSVMASDPGTQALMNEFGGGGYTAYWLAIGDEAAAHEQPQQQQGSSEPDNSQSTQPTNAPSRPGVKLSGDWQPSVPDGYQSAIPQPKAFTGGGAPQPQGYQQPGGRNFGDDLSDAYSTATGIIGRIRDQRSTGPSPQQAAAMAWSTPHR
ncbi:hypothetical protein [Pseudaeromonas pectinilytica]